jgi:hypothetical protein
VWHEENQDVVVAAPTSLPQVASACPQEIYNPRKKSFSDFDWLHLVTHPIDPRSALAANEQFNLPILFFFNVGLWIRRSAQRNNQYDHA